MKAEAKKLIKDKLEKELLDLKAAREYARYERKLLAKSINQLKKDRSSLSQKFENLSLVDKAHVSYSFVPEMRTQVRLKLNSTNRQLTSSVDQVVSYDNKISSLTVKIKTLNDLINLAFPYKEKQ